MKKYYITGVPGSGKTAVVKELAKRGHEAFDMDEVTPGRWINRKTGKRAIQPHGAGASWLDHHAWVYDVEVVRKALAKRKSETVFVSGLTTTQKEVPQLFDKVFLLKAGPEVFTHRMTTRPDGQFGDEPADREHVISWYEDFENSLLRAGAEQIDASQSLDQVVDEIESKL